MALHGGPCPRRRGDDNLGVSEDAAVSVCLSVRPSETLEVLRVVLGALLGGIFIWVSGSDKRKLLTLSEELLSQTNLTTQSQRHPVFKEM